MFAVTYVELDVPNFTPAEPPGFDTFPFALPTDFLPPEIDCIPSIESVAITPAPVSLGEDLGASVSVTFKDHRHIFAGEPYGQGTFWGKWRGRYGTTLRGCRFRLIRGQLGQSLAEMDTRHFLIEQMNGPAPGSAVYSRSR